jgi:hypothetical protein
MTPEETKQWIWSRCTRCDKCLLWDGGVDDCGVPQMRVAAEKKVRPVRRVLLEALGVSVAGKLATTTCGDPRCMDEKHVVAWTRKRLQARSAKSTAYGRNEARRAAIAMKRRESATLNIEKVREMRASGMSSREAAAAYGVTQSTAHKALAGITWRDYGSPFARLGARA